MQIAAESTDDHLARVQPDTDLQGRTVLAQHVVSVSGHGLLHAEGGVAGPDGVVLVGDGGAEEGHDAVAHDLIHCALVMVDGLHHVLEDGIQEVLRFLGVTVGQKFH